MSASAISKSIARIGRVGTGRTPAADDPSLWGGKLEFITPAHIEEDGSLGHSERTLSDAGRALAQVAPRHSVLFVGIGATLGKTAVVDREVAVNQQCHVVQVGSERDAVLLREILDQSEALFWRQAGNGGMPILTKSAFEKTEVPWPAEQCRATAYVPIAALNQLVGNMQELVEAQRLFRRGLMQQLLTGRRRFPEYASRQWQVARFGQLCEELRLRNDDAYGPERVMGVLKGIGFAPMRERVRGKGNLAMYKVVPPGAFAYNPMRLNIGSIAYNDLDTTVLVSPDYVVFRARPGITEPAFINQLRWSAYWSSFMDRAGAGSVRVRIYFSDLERLRVPAPECDEQRRIASILSLLDSEINQLISLQKLMRSQKRGILSRLLNGHSAVAA